MRDAEEIRGNWCAGVFLVPFQFSPNPQGYFGMDIYSVLWRTSTSPDGLPTINGLDFDLIKKIPEQPSRGLPFRQKWREQ